MNEWNINTSLPVNYTIKISNDLFSIHNKDILSIGAKNGNIRRLVVIDKKVYELYFNKIYISKY